MGISWKCHHIGQYLKCGLEGFWNYNFVKPKSNWEPFVVISIFHNGSSRFFKYSSLRFAK